MSGTHRVYKFYWLDQDQEQEAWLRDMARQGFHLTGLNWLGRYTFAHGAPADVVDRIDASANATKPDYCQLIEDAGWERAASVIGWHFWRHGVAGGKLLEIFSDVQSKIAQYKYLRGLWAVFTFSSIVALISIPIRQPIGKFDVVLAAVLAPSMLMTAYQLLRLHRRIGQLRRGEV